MIAVLRFFEVVTYAYLSRSNLLVICNVKLFVFSRESTQTLFQIASLLQILQDMCGFWFSRWAMVEMSKANDAWSCLGSRFVT